MNFELQSKKIKPNAKSCDWCKHLYRCHETIWGEVVDKCTYEDKPGTIRITHGQNLKVIKEESFRYCKSYRYSKKNFNGWKKEREKNNILTVSLY